jgi:glycosyltransferase involved in cell wall biosynthesis
MAPTGFGTVTQDLGRRLLDLGEDVRFWSLNEAPVVEPFASRTMSVLSLEVSVDHPDFIAQLLAGSSPYKLLNGEPWGEWKPEAAIILGDFAAARIFVGQHLDAFRTIPTYHYVPIEGVGLPPEWGALWSVVRPVAMSQFGAAQIAKVVGYDPPLVYHGVDTDDFYPVSRDRPIVITDASGQKPDTVLTSRKQCRAFFLPGMSGSQNWLHPVFDEVWLLRTDRNMPRKRYNSMIRSLAPVLARNPKARAIFHCRLHDEGGYLVDTLSKIPLPLRQQYWPTELMPIWQLDKDGNKMLVPFPRPVLAALYNACDIYVTVSAEGFGLTIAEALACGIPAVGPGYSAVPEVIGSAGVLVPEGYLIDNEYDHFWWAVDEAAYGAAVEALVQRRNRRESLGRLGPRHIRDSFSWDVAAAQFRDLVHASTPVEAAA